MFLSLCKLSLYSSGCPCPTSCLTVLALLKDIIIAVPLIPLSWVHASHFPSLDLIQSFKMWLWESFIFLALKSHFTVLGLHFSLWHFFCWWNLSPKPSCKDLSICILYQNQLRPACSLCNPSCAPMSEASTIPFLLCVRHLTIFIFSIIDISSYSS